MSSQNARVQGYGYFTIDAQDGTRLESAVPARLVSAKAQSLANSRKESVFVTEVLSEPDEEPEIQEVRPR